tara:strand:- start:352 stop:597 length:246 start_codon:yes stop_codon:yes gene_type:complete
MAIPTIALCVFVALDTEGARRMAHAAAAGGVVDALHADVGLGVTDPRCAVIVAHALKAYLLLGVAHADRTIGVGHARRLRL